MAGLTAEPFFLSNPMDGDRVPRVLWSEFLATGNGELNSPYRLEPDVCMMRVPSRDFKH